MSSLKTWLDNPILGICYGASSAVESLRMQQVIGDGNFDLELYLEYSVGNLKTTLPEILVETGTMGAFIVFFILSAGGRFFFQALKSPSIPHYAKLALLALCVIFLTNFLGGNSFASLPFFMTLPLVFLKSRWAPVLPSDSGM